MGQMIQIIKATEEGLLCYIVCPGLPTDQIGVIQKTLDVVNEKSHYSEKWDAMVVNYSDPPT